MLTELVTLQTLQSAQKIYILAFNTYLVYSYASSYYDNTRKVIRGCQTVYVVSSSLMNKLRRWRYDVDKPKPVAANIGSAIPTPKPREIELMDIKQSETPSISKIPASLDDAVIDYFVS